MPLDPLLHLLCRKARLSHQELGELLALPPQTITERLAAWEKDGTIRG